ncbi:MAG TPA: hypothetical protein VJ250_00695 [Nitrososphaeraceae archaeon]|nr:hypothetical protein [Nitrososphaeraceae archaeon]HJY15599.1 hypothetical protein [Nitrososphaeraceae archaeon]
MIKLAATIMTAISVVVSVRAIAGEIDDREDVFMMLGKKNMFYGNKRLKLDLKKRRLENKSQKFYPFRHS